MNDFLKAVLEDWLPTKWSRSIAGLTIASGTGAFFLPEFLKLLCIQVSDHTILLIRIAVPLLLWLFGTFLVLLIVVQHSKTLKAQKQPQLPMPLPAAKPAVLPKEQLTDLNPQYDRLDRESNNFLNLIFEHGELSIESIAMSLNISEGMVRYHRDLLLEANFILQSRGEPEMYELTSLGSKYVVDHKTS